MEVMDIAVPVFTTWNLILNKGKTEWLEFKVFPTRSTCPACDKRCVVSAIQCDVCDAWLHYECTDLSKAAINKLVADPDSTFSCRFCNAGSPPLKARGSEPWRGSKSVGSLLDTKHDIDRRCQLAAGSLARLNKLWMHKHLLSLSRRTRLYNAYVLPVLTYNLGTQALNKQTNNKLDVFHRRQLRRVIGVRFPDVMANEDVYRITGAESISSLALRTRWRLFGHILRLPSDTPAKRAMRAFFLAPAFLKHRKGKSEQTLPTTLAADLKATEERHGCCLKSAEDLLALTKVAGERDDWKRFCAQICL